MRLGVEREDSISDREQRAESKRGLTLSQDDSLFNPASRRWVQ